MVFKRMLKPRGAELQITLDRANEPYYPGDVVTANVQVSGMKEMPFNELRAGLRVWEISISEDSDGDRETRTLTDALLEPQVLLHEGTLTPGFNQSFRASFGIPDDAMPPYFSNDIQSGWAVQATLVRGMKRDIHEEARVSLVVPPPAMRDHPGYYGEANNPKVPMELWLPYTDWVEGETINGKLVITPTENLDVREVRVQLAVKEKVHASRIRRSIGSSPMKLPLAGKTKLHANQPHEFEFNFPIPKIGRPSRQTETTTVTYSLEGVLNRRLRKDFTTKVEIKIFNGPAR